ncbi:MAG: response regulator [Desulfobulbus sp.]|jgi:CheY-like chemotaxis protein|nr:response regulator [Desulfobulbus sp.]
MSVITVFNALHCNEEEIITGLVQETGYRRVDDPEVVDRAASLSGLSADRVVKAFSAKASLFNPFTHEKEKSVVYLRQAVAEILGEGKMVLTGFSSHLVPAAISHVLRICLVAEMSHRIRQAEGGAPPEKDALKSIRKSDEDRSAWALLLHGKADPWDPLLYDIVIPTDKIAPEESVHLIVRNLHSDVLTPTPASLEALADFRLQARVQVALTLEGHQVSVAVRDGAVILTIEKNVLMLSRLEQELQEIVAKVPGVRSVVTQVGPNFHQADIYRKLEFQGPSRVLLVDDEREFVQTLSERLLLRDMGSAVAYDGESALEMLKEDEPEVMILDLKMPGIDGMEVLRQVKATQPEIEVIILTGHGNETDRETCMQLGAFAYLQKPVDIDVLSETMKKANEKIQGRKQAQQGA